MTDSKGASWAKQVQGSHPGSGGFLPYWDFVQADGEPYLTINPAALPDEWRRQQEPANVFEIPEIWYGAERSANPYTDNRPWHEVDFCRRLWEKYSEKEVSLVFEVCCGICPHGSILAREGIKVVGVDASEGMVRAVSARAAAQNLPISAFKRDVFQFSIPGDPPDAAILLGNVFPLSRDNRADNSALVSQLRSVGTFMRRNTLYLIDCGNPEPPPMVGEYFMEAPRTVRLPFATVSVTGRTFPTDGETLATPYIIGYDAAYPSGRVRLELRGARTFVSAQHLAALVELSHVFRLEAFHHWGRPEPGLERGGGPYVAVLRRI
jgi:SAM-dependent methyltransferase